MTSHPCMIDACNCKNKKDVDSPRLLVYNSITRKKEPFETIIPNHIGWYCCGPTVYDSSHMGHARAYISFDIIRRILQRYFNYNVTYVMNITDIDDKIVKRARRSHIWNKFKSENALDTAYQLDVYLLPAFEAYKQKVEETVDPELRGYRATLLERNKALYDSWLRNELTEPLSIDQFEEVISEYLDGLEGSSVTDHSIFFKLTRRFEKEFLEDMKALNVLPPTMMPRISQFVPEVVQFVQRIVDNGYAYSSNGSVYFDTIKFSESHKYAKLVPEAVGDSLKLAAGEGELTGGAVDNEKRSSRDFVLWKASKPGEPSWPSPWGDGRPGWHIECSTMGSHYLGDSMDIHSGGCDLKFPHHDNELAQSEAHFGHHQWVRYFMHAGHLTIEGLKMSKSLKNFITIREALQQYNARQIRLAFLMHHWDGPLDFSTNVMKEAIHWEKSVLNFFSTINSVLRELTDECCVDDEHHNFNKRELDLHQTLIRTQTKVHCALCDNFDTPTSLLAIKSLISSTFSYMNEQNQANIHPQAIKPVADYVFKMMNVFGLPSLSYRGQHLNDSEETVTLSQQQKEDHAWPFVQLISQLRNKVREHAKALKDNELLDFCDKIRDQHLLQLGVLLEDKDDPDVPSAIKFVNKYIFEEKRFEKEEIDQRILEEQLAHKLKLQQSKSQRQAKASVNPKVMFLNETDKYSMFDENGIPTHDSNGEPLSKSAVKKVQKLYSAQEKLFNKHN